MTSSSLPTAIPAGSLVLISGVTGHIASHIADQLLQKGFRVRGTVRNKEKATWIEDLFKHYGQGKFETAVVPDMVQEGAFDEAVEGVSAVIHTASNLSFAPDPNIVINQTLAGVRSALLAAAKTPSVTRFVYTSSSTAASAPKPDVKFRIDSSTWNQADIDKAWAPPPYEGAARSWAVYGASKTQAEQEVWKFVREKKPGFEANCVLPNANLGSILDPVHQPSITAKWPFAILNGELDAIAAIPPQWMVDVRDCARLHVIAAIDPDVAGARLFAYAEPFDWWQLAEVVKKVAGPEKGGKVPGKEALEKVVVGGKDVSEVENGPAEALLRKWYGKGFTGVEESVRENLDSVPK